MGSLGYTVMGHLNPDHLPEFTEDEASQIIALLYEFEGVFADDIEVLNKECYYFPDDVLIRIIAYFVQTDFSKYDKIYVRDTRAEHTPYTNEIILDLNSSEDRTNVIITINPMSMVADRLDTIKNHLTISKEQMLKREINKANASPYTYIKSENETINQAIQGGLRRRKKILAGYLKALEDLN